MNPKLLRSNVLRRIYKDAKFDAVQAEAVVNNANRQHLTALADEHEALARSFRQIELAAAEELLNRKESLQ